MKTQINSLLAATKWQLICGFVGLASVIAPTVHGAGAVIGGIVTYDPQTMTRNGNMPQHETYELKVKSPANFPSGGSSTIGFVVRALTYPTTLMSAATAESYVSIALKPGQPTSFTSGNQEIVYVVTINFPLLVPPAPATSLNYNYEIKTTGWPASIAANLSDNGAFFGATTSVPPPAAAQPPTVSIVTPVNGSVLTYPFGSVPATIPLLFNALAAGPISTLDANVTGPGMSGTPLTVTATGLGVGNVAQGTASIPLTTAGTYTVQANARNSFGSSGASTSFTVVITGAPAPAVTISSPVPEADYTYYTGGTPAVVSVAFTATTPSGTTLQTWSETLTDPLLVARTQSISPGLPSGNSSSGSTSLSLTVTGRYTLDVTAYNQYTSASASTSFWINRVSNPVDQTVNAFQNATFTAAVEGRSDYTFQWYRQVGGVGAFSALTNTSPYSGTSTATLTVTAATVPMSGDKFKCLLTRTAGSVETIPAKLTVNKLNPVLTWPTPSPITYGTALSSTQLNASANVVGTLAYSQSSGVVLNAGSYTLNVNFTPTDSTNYNGATASVPQVVNKAPLTITAVSTTKAYGAANPALSATSGTYVNGDTAAVLTGLVLNTSATNLSPVGSYAIIPSGATAANYSITFVDGALTVNKAPLTVTADNKTKTAGTANPTLTATLSGFVLGQTLSSSGVTGTAGLSTTATTASPAGTYPITVAVGTLAAGNYAFSTLVPGVLTVTPSTTPTLDLVIIKPDGSVITRVAGSPATVVPFKFTATATGATVSTLTAKRGSTTLTVSTKTGIGTATATGEGSFTVSAPGTYTFTATATATGGLVTTRSVTFNVVETQPPPQPCVRAIAWTSPTSSSTSSGSHDGDDDDNDRHSGSSHSGDNDDCDNNSGISSGTEMSVAFKIKECCPTAPAPTPTHNDDDDDDGDDDDHDGNKRSSNNSKSKSSSKSGSSGDRDDNDRDDNDRDDNDRDDDNRSGDCDCTNPTAVRDTNVVVSIYKVGSTAAPKMYTYTSTTARFTIDSANLYQLKYTPTSSASTYRIEVYHFPVSSSAAVLLGKTEFKTR